MRCSGRPWDATGRGMGAETIWEIVQLRRDHERDIFDCGEPVLDEYLRKFARQNQDRDVGRTYVATLPGELRVLGYYTISSGSVAFATLPEADRKRLPRYPVPTVHIGRLAVDRTARGQRLGETLLVYGLE